MNASRLKQFWYVLFPPLLALFLYRRSFRIWFLKDDFAWLGLRLSVSNFSELLGALFTPMAQGTVRFLSERAFFLTFESLFGLESLPMRLWMFLTLAVALVLLTLVAERITGSRVAGVAAAVFWSLNFGVSVAMCWLSSYNQILVSALMLGALYAFQLGNLRWTWICYLLGFGALENIIALPGVLLAWAWFYDRSRVRAALPLFAPAILFVCLHLFVIPKYDTAEIYRMHFDRSILETTATYWQWLLGAVKLSAFSPDYLWLEWPALLGGSGLLLAGLLLGWRRRHWGPLFGLLFSLAAIAPMLPLRDHKTDYYLASASLGLMISFASLLVLTPVALRWALGLALLSYLYPSYLVQRDTFEWYLEATGPARTIVRGAMFAHQKYPDKLIVLDGISAELYGNTIADDGLRLIAPDKLRLAPGNGLRGSTWVLSAEATRVALEKNLARVYRVEGPKLRDVTREWEQHRGPELAGGFAPDVIASEPTFSSQFLDGWYAPADGSRWMSGRALVRLGGGPYGPNAKLRLRFYVPDAVAGATLRVSMNQSSAGEFPLPAGECIREIAVPAAARGDNVLLVELQSSKTVRPPNDGRVLSLVWGELGVR